VPQQRGEALHKARKAAKRARYSAELARPAVGKPAKRLAKRYQQRQKDLGVLQDHRMIVAVLLAVADDDASPARLAFTCGVLAQRHAHELDEALR
jgi:CHAD domain-containing protein